MVLRSYRYWRSRSDPDWWNGWDFFDHLSPDLVFGWVHLFPTCGGGAEKAAFFWCHVGIGLKCFQTFLPDFGTQVFELFESGLQRLTLRHGDFGEHFLLTTLFQCEKLLISQE